jgi:membrane protein DedA with SNARE-associated domain
LREVGPWLVGTGVVLVVVGVLAWTGALSWFGRLPGDVRVTTDHTRLFIPVTSMLVVSVVATVVLLLWRRH